MTRTPKQAHRLMTSHIKGQQPGQRGCASVRTGVMWGDSERAGVRVLRSVRKSRSAEMERSEEKKNGEPHYFTFEVSWEVANKGNFL